MRTNVIGAAAVAAMVAFCGAGHAQTADAKRAAEKERDFMERNGGAVKLGGKGRVAICDCRANADEADCRSGVKTIRDMFKPVVIWRRGTGFSISGAADMVKASGDNAVVFVVDDPSLPMTLTAAEERWGMINAAKAAADRPDEAKFRRRMGLLFLRQCCRLMGSDATKTPECCLYPVFDLADLDAITENGVAISVFIAISESMERIGLEGVEIVSYRDACELGKAPAPTNDLQRTIWKESSVQK